MSSKKNIFIQEKLILQLTLILGEHKPYFKHPSPGHFLFQLFYLSLISYIQIYHTSDQDTQYKSICKFSWYHSVCSTAFQDCCFNFLMQNNFLVKIQGEILGSVISLHPLSVRNGASSLCPFLSMFEQKKSQSLFQPFNNFPQSVLSTLESAFYFCASAVYLNSLTVYLNSSPLMPLMFLWQYLCLQVMCTVFTCCGGNHHLPTSHGSFQQLQCMCPVNDLIYLVQILSTCNLKHQILKLFEKFLHFERCLNQEFSILISLTR